MQNPFGNNNNNDQNPFNLNNLPLPPNYAKIVNDQGDIRIAKVGISWTTLWFGPLPALFRGDYYNFLLIFVLDLAIGISNFLRRFCLLLQHDVLPAPLQ